VARAFMVTPLVETGKASYSLYLVHVPVFWVLQRTLDAPSPATVALVGIPLSIVLALFLHHIVGEPVRLRRWTRPGGTAFAALAAAVCLALVASPTLVRQATGTGDLRVVVLGDSLGHDFATSLSTEAFTVTDRSFNGCGIFGPEASRTAEGEQASEPGCLPWETRWREAVGSGAPDAVLINVAWDAAEQRIDGKWTQPCAPAYAKRYGRQLATALDIVTAGAPARRVLITTARRHTPVATPQAAACHNRLLREFAADHRAVHLLDLDGFVCTRAECPQATPDGEPAYLDGVHFTRAGMRWIAPWLAAGIQEAADAGPGTE